MISPLAFLSGWTSEFVKFIERSAGCRAMRRRTGFPVDRTSLSMDM